MKAFDTYILYKIIRKLSLPFESWKMFEVGLIDHHGNFIVPTESRTDEQNASYSYLDMLILNIKKMLAKIPGGSSRIATLAAAMYLLREGDQADIKQFEGSFENYLKTAKTMLSEEGEAPITNSTENVVKNPKIIKFKNYNKVDKRVTI